MAVPRAPAGFTLIELLVASAVGMIVLTGAATVMTTVAQNLGQVRAQAGLRRTTAVALESLSSDLRQAGLGVPSGGRLGTPTDVFPAAILAGDATTITFLADLPRPNSNFNGIAALSDSQLPNVSALYLLDELNNNCDPLLADTPCATNTATNLFAATTPSCGSSDTAPSCPWGLNKYQPNEYLLLVDGAGTWEEVQVGPTVAGTDLLRRTLALAATTGLGFPAQITGGYATSPDRVSYQLVGTKLQRNQCWGSVGSPISVATLTTACAAGATGTGWETLATGVNALAFSYLNAAGAALLLPLAATDLGKVTQVQVNITASSTSGGIAQSDTESVRITLRSQVSP
jgi:prepilin-type N-terminal cleavage/methylation domain-containing protein